MYEREKGRLGGCGEVFGVEREREKKKENEREVEGSHFHALLLCFHPTELIQFLLWKKRL